MALQTIEIVVRDKEIAFAEGSARGYSVSHNDNYVMHFDLDEQRNAMFAVFVRGDKKAVKRPLDGEGYVLNKDGERFVPEAALAAPLIGVGVISDGYATRRLDYFVLNSIKDFYDEEVIEPDDPLIDQLIALVNEIQNNQGINFTTDETLTLDANHVLSVNTTNNAEEDNTLPITSAGVHTQVGNINALLETI